MFGKLLGGSAVESNFGEAYSLPTTLRLRLDQFEKITQTAGLTTLEAQAAHTSLTIGAISKIRNRVNAPSAKTISCILSAFPQWTFEDFFEVVPTSTPTDADE